MSDELIFGERRFYERKACSFSIGMEGARRTTTGHLRNLSMGGAFIETDHDEKPVVGQEIELTIPFRSRRNHLKITGEIVRIRPDGFGVRFIKPDFGFK
jgi:Tfp pilus assembly protein PilZ